MLACLEIPACSEEKLHLYLAKLEFRVDAWAISPDDDQRKPASAGSSPTRDLVGSEIVAKLDDPFTLVQQGEQEGDLILQLVWEVAFNLGRPRVRLQDPSIVFIPTATIALFNDEASEDGYLKPFVLMEPNMLEPLKGMPGMSDRPYLPLSRLEKVLPTPPKKDERILLHHRVSDPIRAHPVVMPRLKYNKITTSNAIPTTLASLDIDINPLISISGTIEFITLDMATGRAIPLMPDSLPMSFKSKDGMTFLYDLQCSQQLNGTINPPPQPDPANTGSTLNTNNDLLTIKILIKLSLSPISTATLHLNWTTSVDFSLPLNPSFGAPAQTLQRTNRPTSLTFTSYPNRSKEPQQAHRSTTSHTIGTNPTNRTASTSLQHHNIPTSPPTGNPSSLSLSSILSISFMAPERPAQIGVPFPWRVLIINNSSKPVKLAIVPLPRIQRPTNAAQHFAKRHALKASNASLPPSSTSASANAPPVREAKHKRGESVAKAVVDEQLLYALHHPTQSSGASAVPADTELVGLTAELRIGPLGVGQCHETEIRWVAYKTGVLEVDAVRVVDLGREGESGVGVIHDITELPEVVVVDGHEDKVNEMKDESDGED